MIIQLEPQVGPRIVDINMNCHMMVDPLLCFPLLYPCGESVYTTKKTMKHALQPEEHAIARILKLKPERNQSAYLTAMLSIAPPVLIVCCNSKLYQL
jgi:hypothetical protein